jgi:hypothetical protein
MNEIDITSGPNDNKEEQEEVEVPENKLSEPESRDGFRYYSSCLLMILGVSLIGLFLAQWFQMVLVEKEMGRFYFEGLPSYNLLWRILASTINVSYFYAILGIILCLLAIHLVGRRKWYRAVPILVFFAALNAVILTVGFLGFAFVMDWGNFWPPRYFPSVLTILNFLVEVGAFIAIIVVEMPYLRKLLDNWRSRKQTEAGLIEE